MLVMKVEFTYDKKQVLQALRYHFFKQEREPLSLPTEKESASKVMVKWSLKVVALR